MQQLRLRDLLPENVSVYNIQDRNFRFQQSVSGRCLCAEPRSAECQCAKLQCLGSLSAGCQCRRCPSARFPCE